MRVIAGIWGGRTFDAPPGMATRPLTDRVKQGLFDWMGQHLDGLRCADLHAGSGAWGIEAGSRGASVVHLCEIDRGALTTLRRNVAKLGDPPQLVVHAKACEQVLPQVAPLDVAFADPPFPWFFDEDGQQRLAALVAAAGGALAPGGRLYVRGDEGGVLPAHTLVERDRRSWGRSWIALLERPA